MRHLCVKLNCNLFCFPGIFSYKEAKYWWEKSKPCNMGMFTFLFSILYLNKISS